MTYTYSFVQPFTDPAFSQQTTLIAAWGMKKINAGYSGSCLRVRRSSDDTESDIGFSGSEVDAAAAQTFVGGGNNGFMTKWYEQVGTYSGLDAIQATNANQPRCVNAGTFDAPGSKNAGVWDGSNDYLSIGVGSGGNLDSGLFGLTWVIDWYANAISAFPGLLGKGNADSSSSGSYILDLFSSTRMGWIVYTGSARTTECTTALLTVTTSTWYQSAAIWQAGVEGRLYLDATSVADDVTAGSVIDAAGYECLFGTNEGNAGNKTAYPFNGAIRSIRLYEGHLTSAEVSSLFSSSPP